MTWHGRFRPELREAEVTTRTTDGGMPTDMVRESIRRFGDVVAPAVRHVLSR